MKNTFKKPTAMKNFNRLPEFNFSAYPLKALNLPAEEKKSYLHIYKKQSKTKPLFHARILPMTLSQHEQAVKEYKENKQNDNMEERESDWFASYE